MATIEGAKALGMHREIGSLEQGKRADFIAVDTMQPSMMPIYTHPMRNMVPNLVYSARGCEVDVSVVEGRVIMEHQKLLAVDETQYLEQMQTRAQDLGQRATEMFEKYMVPMLFSWKKESYERKSPFFGGLFCRMG